MLNRKQLLGYLARLPVAGSLFGSGMIATVAGRKLERPRYQRNYFAELGVRPFINGRGTITALSGSLMPTEVMEAINYASRQFVDIEELQDRVGERIASMLNTESAMVTAGAASAMTLGTAACITGKNREKIRLLPEYSGPQPEVIVQKTHRFVYDHAVRNCGVRMVEVEGPEEMENAISERTVMALWFNAAAQWGGGYHSVPKETFVKIGKQYNVPTFNDASADTPPLENLFRYQEMGFDLVTFSGGKAIRGPQSAGLLFGRRDLIEAARLNNSPYADSIGRGMKVNKEEILAMMVALEKFLERDHDRDWTDWEEWVERIGASARTLPSVETTVHVPEPAGHAPHLGIRWDPDVIPLTPREAVLKLRNGHPSIEVAARQDELYIAVYMMEPEEIGIVARRVREVLYEAI